MLRLYKRGNFKACNIRCAEGFRADRKAGLNYGLFKFADGSFARNREHASRRANFCAYCGLKP